MIIEPKAFQLRLSLLFILSVLTLIQCSYDLEIVDRTYLSNELVQLDYRQLLGSTAIGFKLKIQNVTFDCLGSEQLSSTSYFKPLFQIENAGEILIQNSTFTNCYTTGLVSLLNVTNSTVIISQSNFINISAIDSGILKCQQCNITMTSNYISNILSQNGQLRNLHDVLNERFLASTDSIIRKSLISIIDGNLKITANRIVQINSIEQESVLTKVYYLERSSYSDDLSTYFQQDSISSFSSLIDCSSCKNISMSSASMIVDSYSPLQDGGILTFQNQQGDILLSQVSANITARSSVQNLIQLDKQESNTTVKLLIDAANIFDLGQIFESGLVFFTQNTLAQNFEIRNTRIQKANYLSKVINAGALKDFIIKNVTIQPLGEMKSSKIHEFESGLINITGFLNLSVTDVGLQCSQQSLDINEILLRYFASNPTSSEGKNFNPVFKAEGKYQIQGGSCAYNLNTGWSGCSFNQVRFERIRINNCRNFDNGVFLQCHNCQNLTVFSSEFQSISKSYRSAPGGQSGLIQLDESPGLIIVDNCTFKNILTEGNAIFTIRQKSGLIELKNSRFINIHSYLINGGLLTTALKKSRYDVQSVLERGLDVKLVMIQNQYVNVSSVSSGAILWFDPYQIRNFTMVDSYFLNITTQGAGAVFKMEGMAFSTHTLRNLTIKQAFAMKGGAIDIGVTYDVFSITQLYVECFAPSSSLLVNPQMSKQNFPFTPGPFYKFGEINVRSKTKFFKNFTSKAQSINLSQFNNCISFGLGGVIQISDWKSFGILNSIFVNNSAYMGGSIGTYRTDITVRNCTFINNSAVIGAAIGQYFLRESSSVIRSTARDNYALQMGGFQASIGQYPYYFTPASSQPSQAYQITFFNVDTCQIINNSAKFGGAIYSDSDQMYHQIYYTNFTSNRATNAGGVLHHFGGNYLYMVASTQSKNYAPIGAVLYLIVQDPVLASKTFTQLVGNTIDCGDQEIPNLYYVFNAMALFIQSQTLRNCVSKSDKLSLFMFENTQVVDVAGTYSNNVGVYGGIYKLHNSFYQTQQNTYTNNSAKSGGVIYAKADSVAFFTTSNFIGNKAAATGGVGVATSGSIICFDSVIVQQSSAQKSAVIDIMSASNNTKFSLFYNSQFIQNNAISSLLTFSQAIVEINNCQFIDNTASQDSNGILSTFSTISITNSVFSQTTLNKLTQNQASFIKAVFQVSLTITQSQFMKNAGKIGSVFYISGESNITAVGCTFQNNYASQIGGVLFAQQFKSIKISSSQFTGNTASFRGDDIYLTNSQQNSIGEFKDLQIQSVQGKQSIYAEKASLKLDTVFLQGEGNNYQQISLGSGLQAIDCHSITVNNSIFRNLSAFQGGAIYIKESDFIIESSSTINQGLNLIRNSSFAGCSAQQGGSLFLINARKLIMTNSSFLESKALRNLSNSNSGKGGAIYHTSNFQNTITSFILDKSMIFVNNSAESDGGAIYWDSVEPIFINGSQNVSVNQVWKLDAFQLMFKNNTANGYGNNIGSYPQKIKQMSQTSQNSSNLEDSQSKSNWIAISNFRSGDQLPALQLSIVDIYDQVITSDSQTVVTLLVNTSFSEDPSSNDYPSVAEGLNSFQAINGYIDVDKVKFFSSPGFNHSIYLQASSIDMEKLSSKQLLSQLNMTDLNLNILIDLRNCALGEQFTPSGKCEMCPEGTFSLQVMNTQGVCQSCPEGAICKGGSQIGPLHGYWRPKNSSDYFRRCTFSDSCLGMNESNGSLTGSCSEGYTGVLCSNCAHGYFKSSDRSCKQCDSKQVNQVRLVFAGFGFLMIVYFIIRNMDPLDSLNYKNSFIKLMFHHFQLLAITLSITDAQPSTIKGLSHQFMNAATYGLQSLDFKCLWESDQPINDYMMYEVILASVYPFMFSSIAILLWIFSVTLMRKSLYNFAYQSVVVTFTLMQPQILLIVVKWFQFEKVNGKYMVKLNLGLEFWCDKYQETFNSVLVPSILFWAFIGPFTTLVLLAINRKNLIFFEYQKKLNFLINEYKLSYYYWEVLISFRKVIILALIIVTQNLGEISQSIFVSIVYLMQNTFDNLTFLQFNFHEFENSTFQIKGIEYTRDLLINNITHSTLCGCWFASHREQSWLNANPDRSSGLTYMNKEGQSFFEALVIISISLYFVAWIMKLLSYLKRYLMIKHSYMYSRIATCTGQKLDKSSLNQSSIIMKSLEYQEEYLGLIQNLKQSIRNRGIMLTDSNLKSLKYLLRKDKIYKFIYQKNINYS